MNLFDSHNIIPAIFLCCSLFLSPFLGMAQERDTAGVEIDRESDRTLLLDRQLDRSMSGGSMTEMGTYNMPSEQQFYQRPFKGQQYLDMALKAYREDWGDTAGDDWYWQFLRAVSPYINLRLGAFETMQMEYVDRNNPLFESYNQDVIPDLSTDDN